MAQSSSSSLPWKHHSMYSKETLIYLNSRRKGKIHSLRTPFKKINKSSINGFEMNTINVFAGRPSHGKTLIAEQIIREVEKTNPGVVFKTLQFNFEMVGRSSKIRELTSVTNKSYSELCSAEEPLEDDVFNKCLEYLNKTKSKDVDVVDSSKTVEEIAKIIRQYMEYNSSIITVNTPNGPVKKKVYKNTIITLDHTLLVKMKKGQSDKKEMLFDLGEALNIIKKEYPIWIILLSQLNRNITATERNKDGSAANYPTDGDLYGSDAIMQYADNIYIITLPSRRNITFYGPDEFIIEDDTIVAVHIIKSRSGSIGLTFLKADYTHMRLHDMDTPGQRMKTPQNRNANIKVDE